MSSFGGCRHFAVWLTPECWNCSREIKVLAFAYVNDGALWCDFQILKNTPTFNTVCTLIFISLKNVQGDENILLSPQSFSPYIWIYYLLRVIFVSTPYELKAFLKMIALPMETEPGQMRALKTLENYVSSKKINQTRLLRRQKNVI